MYVELLEDQQARKTMILLIVSCCLFAAGEATKICINNGEKFCSNCSINASTRNLLRSFDDINASEKVDIIFCSSHVSLEGPIMIQNRHSILMESYGTNISTISCTDNQKFAIEFRNVSNMTLQNLVIEKCGTGHESSSINGAGRSSIYIRNSYNIRVTNVNIANSYGTGLTLVDTSGFVHIENCTFENNFMKNQSDVSIKALGGGGLYIELTHCDSLKVNCSNGSYTIKECTFKDNIASTVEEKVNIRATGSNFQGFGRGGGLCIFIRGQAANNTIDITNCFFSNNSAVWGGGLYIAVRDSPLSNTISVRDTEFEKNSCLLNGGGAVSVGFLFFADSEPKKNKIKFHNCRHHNNSAEYAGGTLIYSSLEKSENKLNNEITFTQCTWRENSAKFGSGVSVVVNSWSMLYRGFSLIPGFKDCTFDSNFIDNSLTIDRQNIEGKGTFLAVKSDVRFEGKTDFCRNNDTALYLISSNAIFAPNSQANFITNRGRFGGAIIILGFSSLQINDTSTFNFSNNKAREKGGAIYQHSQNVYDYFASRSCFILYIGEKNNTPEREIHFFFKGNQAGYGNKEKHMHLGHSIYAGTLHACFTGCQNSELVYNETFDCIANFTFEKKRKYEISSAGEYLKLTSPNSSLYAIPGESILLPINLKDGFKNEVSALYHLFILNQSCNSNISIASDDNYISDKWVRFFGKPGDSAILRVETEDIWEVAFTLEVNMVECPPGYILQVVTINEQERAKCECFATSQLKRYEGVIADCNASDYTANMRIIYWLGYEGGLAEVNGRENNTLSSYCPPGYCVEKYLIKLPNRAIPKKLDESICRNRTGKLCGNCRGNYSSYYHNNNFDCLSSEKCGIGWLFYLISEILPITIFFMVIIIFNVNVTDGAINGLVFYFQVTGLSIQRSSSPVRCPSPVPDFLEVYQLLVGVFNLKFFNHKRLSFCLWPEAQTLDLQAFRYVTITYSLLLVVMIIGVLRVCNLRKMTQKIPKLCGREIDIKSTIIHSLSGFLVICYSESTKISLLLLTPVTIYTRYGSYTAVFYNGELDYFRRMHLAYAVPALFFLIIFGLVPPLLLVAYPLCYRIFGLIKISESKFVLLLCKLIPLEKFKPFFDSFQSSYKDGCRFFSGLYFFYRLFILLTFSISRSYTVYYLTMITGLTFILCLHAVMQPYKKRCHNILDSFIFLNLIVLEVLNFYNYRRALESIDRSQTINKACGVGTIFLYLPLVYYVAIIIRNIVRKFKMRIKMARRKERDISRDQELSESLLFGRRTSGMELKCTAGYKK